MIGRDPTLRASSGSHKWILTSRMVTVGTSLVFRATRSSILPMARSRWKDSRSRSPGKNTRFGRRDQSVPSLVLFHHDALIQIERHQRRSIIRCILRFEKIFLSIFVVPPLLESMLVIASLFHQAAGDYAQSAVLDNLVAEGLEVAQPGSHASAQEGVLERVVPPISHSARYTVVGSDGSSIAVILHELTFFIGLQYFLTVGSWSCGVK